MWILKRTLGAVQLAVAALLLLVAVSKYFGNDKPIDRSKVTLIAYFALNAITGAFLLFTPRPPPREPQPVSEQDRFF